MGKSALVLGGGGITGVAWEMGVIKGLYEAGVDVRSADTVIGTSAGSVVGTLVLCRDLDELNSGPERLNDKELGGNFSPGALLRAVPQMVSTGGPIERRRRIGKVALAAHERKGPDRVELLRERLEVTDWPKGRDLKVTTVCCETGELVVFDSTSGVDLVRAVAASCAVPMVWAPVEIDGLHYIDGGVRSPTNIDLAKGAETLLVLSPLPVSTTRYHSVREQLHRVNPKKRVVLTPDADARKAMGYRVLDPSRSPQAIAAGERQGAEAAARVAAMWPSSA
jgi:NTE family protein